MRRSSLLITLGFALTSCGDPSGSRSSSGGTSASSAEPSAQGSVPAAPSSSASARPARAFPAIRDNSSVGSFTSGAALEVRAFVSRLTTKDSILVAIKLRPEKPLDQGHPWYEETFDWSEALTTLRVEVAGPGGKHELAILEAPKTPVTWQLANFKQALEIGPAALTLRHRGGIARADRLAWKTPPPSFLEKPGKYTVTISSEIKTKATTLSVASKPIEIEVVEAGPSQLTLAELEAAASKAANGGAAPTPFSAALHGPPIEDVDGNRSFELRSASLGYDVDMVEVLLDPSGKQLHVNQYKHFTCVAAGTAIATPDGPVPVEALRVGHQVSSFDVEGRRPAVATVVAVESASTDRLIRIGDLRVTASHPIFVDGTWRSAETIEPGMRLLRQGGGELAAAPELQAASSMVYDISVTEPHNYFAGGVLVHNKAVSVPLHDGAAWDGWFSRRYLGR